MLVGWNVIWDKINAPAHHFLIREFRDDNVVRMDPLQLLRTCYICPTCSFERSKSSPKCLLNIQGAYKRNHMCLFRNQLSGTYYVLCTGSFPAMATQWWRNQRGPLPIREALMEHHHCFPSCPTSQWGHCPIPWKSQTLLMATMLYSFPIITVITTNSVA